MEIHGWINELSQCSSSQTVTNYQRVTRNIDIYIYMIYDIYIYNNIIIHDIYYIYMIYNIYIYMIYLHNHKLTIYEPHILTIFLSIPRMTINYQRLRIAMVISSWESSKSGRKIPNESGWWFQPTPLKNDGFRQLGWWNSQLNGKIKTI